MGAQTSHGSYPPEAYPHEADCKQNRRSPEKTQSPSQVRNGDEFDTPRDLTMQSPVNKYRGEQGFEITQDTPSGTHGTQEDRGGIVARRLRNTNNQNNELRNKGREVKKALNSEDPILSIMRNPPKKLRL